MGTETNRFTLEFGPQTIVQKHEEIERAAAPVSRNEYKFRRAGVQALDQAQRGVLLSRKHTVSIAFATAMLACALPGRSMADPAGKGDDLTGAWRGTMTESSNYDAVPPVPPAYGVWKKVGAGTYEARYQFFQSRTVASADELVRAGGSGPPGYGTISQTVTLSADGKSFHSKLHLELFGQDGKPVAGGGDATARGTGIE